MTTPTMKSTQDMIAFGQANAEAMLKAAQIWSTGLQDLGRHVAASAQSQFDATMAQWKAFGAVRSVREAFDLQASLARTSMETAVAEGGRITDASLKLTEQAMAPIAARLTQTVGAFSRA